MDNWESVKISFGEDSQNGRPRSINFSSVLEVVDDMKMKDIVRGYNEAHGTDLKVRGKSTVLFPTDMIMGFFEPVLRSIKAHVQSLLRQHSVQYLYLVGGFGESLLLQKEVKNAFQNSRRKVVVPMRPSLAVLRGAAMFGLESSAFTSRITRFTYGVGTAPVYDEHNLNHVGKEYQTCIRNGKPVIYLKHSQFTTLVHKGVSVEMGEEHGSDAAYYALRDTQRSVGFTLYGYSQKAPSFMQVNQPGLVKIGKVTVPISSCDDGCKFKMQFGATELLISATNVTTGVSMDATISFEF